MRGKNKKPRMNNYLNNRFFHKYSLILFNLFLFLLFMLISEAEMVSSLFCRVPIKSVFINNSSELSFPFEQLSRFVSLSLFHKQAFFIENGQENMQFFSISGINYSLYRVNDTFVSSGGFLIKDGILYSTSSFYHGNMSLFSYGFKWCGNKDRVLLLSHIGSTIFGHFFIDFLSPLMLLPQEIYQNSVIPFVENPRFYMKICLRLFGIPEKNVVVFNRNEFMYCKTVFFLNPYPHYFFSNGAYFLLSQRLRDYLHLPNVTPTKYFFSNRIKGPRGISNMKNIIESLSILFPSVVIHREESSKTLRKNAFAFNQAKLYFCGFHGSGFANLFFMRPLTVYVEIQTFESFPSALYVCSSLGVNYFYSTMSSIKHFNKSSHYVPQSVYLPLLEKAIKYSLQN